MNICFLSREYPPETHVGGIATYTYNMAGALSRLGHTVHVVTSTKKNEQTTEDNGVLVHRIRVKELMPMELKDFYYSYSVAKKIAQIDCSFDIVHASEYAHEAFYYGLHKKSPLITRLATPFFMLEALNGKMFFGPRPLFNWMEKKQTINSDGIFSSTGALAKVVSDEWKIELSRIEVIPNSLDLSRIEKLGESGDIPEGLTDREYMVYFGRMEERKGMCVLAEALNTVFEKNNALQMVFVGADFGYKGSSMIAHIKEKAGRFSDRLKFFDNLPQDKLFPLVKSSKIVVLPSLWEAFGFVCLEAMALGRPVIASSGSGFEEIIEDNRSGYLVEPGNSDLLGARINDTLSDETKLKTISEGALRRAKDFEVSKVALRLLDYYQKIREEWLRKNGN